MRTRVQLIGSQWRPPIMRDPHIIDAMWTWGEGHQAKAE